MANTITVAQIHMLARFTEILNPNEELQLVFRHLSGNVHLRFREITIEIYPNGSWESRVNRTGEFRSKGEYSGKANATKAHPTTSI